MDGVQVGWGGGYGNGEMNVQSTAEMGKDVCPNFLPLFLENIDRSSCNDGNWEFIPVLHSPVLLFQHFNFRLIFIHINIKLGF